MPDPTISSAKVREAILALEGTVIEDLRAAGKPLGDWRNFIATNPAKAAKRAAKAVK